MDQSDRCIRLRRRYTLSAMDRGFSRFRDGARVKHKFLFLASRPNTPRILFALAFSSLYATGCTEMPADAKARMVQAEKDYRAGRVEESRTKLDELIKQYPKAKDAAEAYYLRAQCNAQTGNKGAAQSDIERCLALAQNADLIARAHAMAATLAYESGDVQRATEHYRQAFKNLPNRPPYDLARYRYGMCLAQQGEWKYAREQWQEVVKEYNGSEMAQQAQRMLSWPSDFFSIQCGAYREKNTAVKQKDELLHAGLNARVETRQRSGETLQMVYIGQYPRLDQAQSAVRNVQKKVPAAVIVPQ